MIEKQKYVTTRMSSATRAKNKVLGEENQALMQTEAKAGPSEGSVKARRVGRTVGGASCTRQSTWEDWS